MAKTTTEPAPALRRTLHAPGLVIHYITSVIGVGVLIIPGHVAAAAGPLSLVAWVLLVAYSYPFAMIFARLSIRYPSSRGITGFIEYAFGRFPARWASAFLVLTLLVANPVLGLAGARYLINIWDPDPSNLNIIGVGSLLVLGSILFNLIGVRLSTRVQGIVLGSLIAFLVLVMVIALPHAHAGNLTPFAPQGWLALGQALIICFFGFIGWENAAPVAEEVADPPRTFPKAIFWAVLSVGALYFAMALTVVLVLPSSGSNGQQITAFSTLLKVASGREVSQVGNVVAVVLLMLAANAWALGTSRVIYSSARDGLLPSALAKVSRSHGVPWAALVFLVVGYGIPVGLLALSGADETMLITASAAAFLLIFLATFLAAHKLLEGKAIKACNLLVIVVTIGILPFFGKSLIFAGSLIALGLLIVLLRRHASSATELAATREGEVTV